MSVKGQHILDGLQKKLTPSPIATLASSVSSQYHIESNKTSSRTSQSIRFWLIIFSYCIIYHNSCNLHKIFKLPSKMQKKHWNILFMSRQGPKSSGTKKKNCLLAGCTINLCMEILLQGKPTIKILSKHGRNLQGRLKRKPKVILSSWSKIFWKNMALKSIFKDSEWFTFKNMINQLQIQNKYS